jgi:hypothetical protein
MGPEAVTSTVSGTFLVVGLPLDGVMAIAIVA